jgi:hypothetical protein
LQQLYTSGPSGHVNLAGDFIFGDGGFSQEPLLFHYPVKRAVAMGICKSKHSTATTGPSAKYAVVDDKRDKPLDHLASKTVVSLFDRHLRLFTDGRRLLLVDQKEPGKVSRNPTNSLTEYLVQDALSLATILDIKHLLGNHKKLHIA